MKNSSAYKNLYKKQISEQSLTKSDEFRVISKDKKQLIESSLKETFDERKFINLIKNIFNQFSLNLKDYPIPKAFAEYIKQIKLLGKYKDHKEKKISCFVVHLNKKTSLERARTKQRNCIAIYLKQTQEDGALVAFVAPNQEDWRFSFVKMEYSFDEKGKVKEEFTPARRYSFLVGKNESSHTAQKCLIPLLEEDNENPTLKDLEKAFSVEKVTKEFFTEYRNLFWNVKEILDKFIEQYPKIKAEFKNKNISSDEFSKKLLGQIVFLYFLQKKGWFGVKREAKWGTGSKHFLRDLFKKEHGSYNNFFNDILEPLFYEALQSERTNDYYSRFNCRIPFLNGGLFEPISDYDWVNMDILLPNTLFSNNHKTKKGDIGDGILDIFDRYNFTVNEDEPLEKEVAVDPEMLGKVFENLLEVKDRKSKGTYYTPREIVHYMCQESLINYLDSVIPLKLGKKSRLKKKGDLFISHDTEIGIQKTDLNNFIKISDSSIEHDKDDDKKKVKQKSFGGIVKESKYNQPTLPKSITEHADLIDRALADIRVCDPAVGSGAFLVGMMNEIIRARKALTPYISNHNDRILYHFKRHAIEHCLYGVDVDKGAIKIAKLRLWLSLMVDEEEREKVKPLPNLDYKLICGNSLLGIKKEDGGGTIDRLFENTLKNCMNKKIVILTRLLLVKKSSIKKKLSKLLTRYMLHL